MSLSDQQVDDIEDYILSFDRLVVGKTLANFFQVPVEDCNYVLKELHYDGLLAKHGTYYGRQR